MHDANSNRVIVVGKHLNDTTTELVDRICHFLLGLGKIPTLDPTTSKFTGLEWDSVKEEQKFSHCIAIGGDGTMMGAARTYGLRGIPLVGVNKGRVGFLTDIPEDSVFDKLNGILNGEFKKEEREILSVSFYKNDGTLIQEQVAVNDFVVRSKEGKFINFTMFTGNEFISSQYSDGVIVATPTGSTAHALSAGGPIVHPGTKAWITVPICPLSLGNRPLVIPSDMELTIFSSSGEKLTGVCDGLAIHCDGKAVVKKKDGYTIYHHNSYSYFEGLRNKLSWA